MNEDIYAHNVLGDFVAPGTCIGDQIIFACQPVEDSFLCEQMRNFWEDWVGLHAIFKRINHSLIDYRMIVL